MCVKACRGVKDPAALRTQTIAALVRLDAGEDLCGHGNLLGEISRILHQVAGV